MTIGVDGGTEENPLNTATAPGEFGTTPLSQADPSVQFAPGPDGPGTIQVEVWALRCVDKTAKPVARITRHAAKDRKAEADDCINPT
jgi:hypothetical protein